MALDDRCLTPLRENQRRGPGGFGRESWSGHGLFSSYKGQQEAANGHIYGAFFRYAQGFRWQDAG